MIGINLEIPNEWGNMLAKLFSGIPLGAKKIKSYDSEVHLKGLAQQLFDEDYYSGEEFNIAISKEDYYIIFLNLDIYPIQGVVADSKISSLKEFKNSDCEIVLRIVDCESTTILAKNPTTLEKIRNNIISLGYFYSEISEEEASDNPNYYFGD